MRTPRTVRSNPPGLMTASTGLNPVIIAAATLAIGAGAAALYFGTPKRHIAAGAQFTTEEPVEERAARERQQQRQQSAAPPAPSNARLALERDVRDAGRIAFVTPCDEARRGSFIGAAHAYLKALRADQAQTEEQVRRRGPAARFDNAVIGIGSDPKLQLMVPGARPEDLTNPQALMAAALELRLVSPGEFTKGDVALTRLMNSLMPSSMVIASSQAGAAGHGKSRTPYCESWVQEKAPKPPSRR